MIVSKIGTKDIVNIGSFGKIEVEFQDKDKIKSVNNLISRAKRLYRRADGLTYTTSVHRKKDRKILVIEVVRQEDVNRKRS